MDSRVPLATIKLLQLPVPPPSYYAATGNVPLAAASLASSLSIGDGSLLSLDASAISPEDTDVMGDVELVDFILDSDPDYVGFSLYLWNTERSLHIASEIKKRKKETTIIIGGPEVSPDNPFVLKESGYDIAVSGEAEHSFVKLMKTLLSKGSLKEIENVAYRKPNGMLTDFSKELAADFPLNEFPSPYVSGFLAVNPNRSTYLETVRGCKSQCTYCFYPKSSQNLRTLDIDETVRLISKLKDQGAKELVFLDPTFNHRPGFEKFLDAIGQVNADGQMTMFAELRSEGVTPNLAKKMAKAGFNRVELGMQSINPETLKRVKRYGDPHKVAEVAKMLASEGIELLLDLIIGLPGDKPEDVERGIHFFLEHGLGQWVQAFPLSLLPGTAMRKDAERDGLIYMPTPPYRIIRTPEFSEEDLIRSLYLAEDLLERRLDEFPRPFLCEPKENLGDTYDLNLSKANSEELLRRVARPGSRHHALWFESENWDRDLGLVLELIKRRLAIDPFCTVDLVFYTDQILSPKFFALVKAEISKAKQSYLSRVLAHRDENMQHRLVCIQKIDADLGESFGESLFARDDLFYYEERKLSSLPKDLSAIGIQIPMVYIKDENCPQRLWTQLKTSVDPEAISFRSRSLEKRWAVEVLGYGEV